MKIVAFGEVMMRMMVPDYKLLTQSHQLEFMFTGTGVNVLSGLSHMGDETYLCSVLPDHHIGQAARADIRRLGIHDDAIYHKGNHIGIYFLEKGYGVRPDQVTYLNRKESSFGKAELSDIDIDQVLKDKDALHLCGIALAISDSTRQLAMTLAKEAKHRGITVIFDCNYRSSLWSNEERSHAKQYYAQMLELADIVFAGVKDATLMFDITSTYSPEEQEYLPDILMRFQKMFHIACIAGTLRDSVRDTLQGYQLTSTGFYQSKKHQLTIYDRIGGGDAFAAGYLYAIYHMEDPIMQIEYATCSGVLGHTTYGDSPVVSKADILEYMEHGKSDIKR